MKKKRPRVAPLRRCPFCGCDVEPTPTGVLTPQADGYAYECKVCHMQGPIGRTKGAARKLWNARWLYGEKEAG